MTESDFLPVTLTAKQAQPVENWDNPDAMHDENECEICREPIARGLLTCLIQVGIAIDNPDGSGNLVIHGPNCDTIVAHLKCLGLKDKMHISLQ